MENLFHRQFELELIDIFGYMELFKILGTLGICIRNVPRILLFRDSTEKH